MAASLVTGVIDRSPRNQQIDMTMFKQSDEYLFRMAIYGVHGLNVVPLVVCVFVVPLLMSLA
jgi:hypothetical protein